MIAMMFPAIAPTLLVFARVQYERRRGRYTLAPTLAFLGTYLLTWTLFGVLAYLGALAAEELAREVLWLTANAAHISGGLLMTAGLYQFTLPKRSCLANCRTPLKFVRASWRKAQGYLYGIGERVLGAIRTKSLVSLERPGVGATANHARAVAEVGLSIDWPGRLLLRRFCAFARHSRMPLAIPCQFERNVQYPVFLPCHCLASPQFGQDSARVNAIAFSGSLRVEQKGGIDPCVRG